LAHPKLCQSRDGGCSDDRVFEDDPIVDIPDVLGRLCCLGAFEADKMENPDSKFCEFAIFDKLAKVCEGFLLGVRYKLDKVEHALHNCPLKFVAPLIAQDPAQEREHAGLLVRELEAKGPDCLHDGNLKLIRDFGHEAGNLLHEAIHASLITGLQKGCDGKCRDGPVAVGDEQLDIWIAIADGGRLERCNIVQNPQSRKLGHGPRRCQEELEDVDGIQDLGIGNVTHVAYGLGSFEVDHLALMSEPPVEQLHHGLPKHGVLLGKLGGQPNQHDNCSRALDGAGGAECLHHLHQRHPVVHAHLVQEPNGMVLRHGRVVGRHCIARRESEREPARGLVGRGRLLRLALPSPDDILCYREEVV